MEPCVSVTTETINFEGTPADGFLPTPKAFSGEIDKCAGFLTQCALQFCQQPQAFSNDGAKIAYIVQLLQDRALIWAQAVLHANPDITYSHFLDKFKGVFDRKSTTLTAGQRLLALKQGKRSVADFSIDFFTLAEQTKWEEEALKSTLLSNVNEEIKKELMLRELPSSLDALMTLCVWLDDRVRAHTRTGQESLDYHGTSPAGRGPRDSDTCDEEEPMQLGHSRLTPAERQRRLATGECVYCGCKGHSVSSCPTLAKGRTHQ
ncbi:unnamed protein product [Oreochromis niloticus]|nr:unnamed protein product [Mustela putorius furo]